ncbi:hypothetical protein BDBG_06548 [Blastomyces gilchristii SLH14081]|uniref:MARVEL domain-containing protein n=1 Tax=Blastomyces gilchristii (strain SLH14081) TaxID=559298 RepID=A0A179URS6_BLAGS|nr:uncharacterized protein BDBG_06548 [Blastomyces gilchristii SLH14081]OAT10744.1 hypothetical protein BDBG_06548 [Blastomyces gilchristii SLH14081]
MSAAGIFIRFTNLLFRLLQLACSVIILGIFSYFLAVLTDHNMPIARWIKAVEGISGAATLYTLAASIFTLCIGGIAFFAALMLILDVCFIAGFIAIAIMTRHGADSCSGIVNTPLGTGNANRPAPGFGEGGFGTGHDKNFTYLPSLRSACRLQKGSLAVAVIGCILFALSLYPQVLYARHHKRGKRFGPSPRNNYTEGPSRTGPRSLWGFGPRRAAVTDTSANSYPLEANRVSGYAQDEKPPNRYAGIFTRGRKSRSSTAGGPGMEAQPQTAGYGAPATATSAYVHGGPPAAGAPGTVVDNTTGVGGYEGGVGGGTSAGYANYGYGQSGAADDGYSYGYGARPQHETAQIPVASGQRNF